MYGTTANFIHWTHPFNGGFRSKKAGLFLAREQLNTGPLKSRKRNSSRALYLTDEQIK